MMVAQAVEDVACFVDKRFCRLYGPQRSLEFNGIIG